ncbi:hypothetical protein [Thalassolituus marinus]|uniref:Uncharacterized protein n=1 Tax=Thalassolituus marinus TaxID=671053 RepID=A0ABS7ZV42_9GAMM|nr:hypothetical protein [Thalassolituus marinus]MCA6065457.1 hypothetical protein [Thalassolituus marinus]
MKLLEKRFFEMLTSASLTEVSGELILNLADSTNPDESTLLSHSVEVDGVFQEIYIPAGSNFHLDEDGATWRVCGYQITFYELCACSTSGTTRHELRKLKY